jgi:hypothetical protein
MSEIDAASKRARADESLNFQFNHTELPSHAAEEARRRMNTPKGVASMTIERVALSLRSRVAPSPWAETYVERSSVTGAQSGPRHQTI